jgi:hypothetical protein
MARIAVFAGGLGVVCEGTGCGQLCMCVRPHLVPHQPRRAAFRKSVNDIVLSAGLSPGRRAPKRGKRFPRLCCILVTESTTAAVIESSFPRQPSPPPTPEVASPRPTATAGSPRPRLASHPGTHRRSLDPLDIEKLAPVLPTRHGITAVVLSSPRRLRPNPRWIPHQRGSLRPAPRAPPRTKSA